MKSPELIFLCCSDGIPPYAEFSLPQLSASQPYDVSLHLVIPASDSNYDLGNFMASLTLATPSNKTLATVRRPVCIFPVVFVRRLLTRFPGYRPTSTEASFFLFVPVIN